VLNVRLVLLNVEPHTLYNFFLDENIPVFFKGIFLSYSPRFLLEKKILESHLYHYLPYKRGEYAKVRHE